MAPIRVLVVDDTAVIRRLVSEVLEQQPDIEVVGTASNGRLALQQIALLDPDVVTLDVEMPVMDGLATLAELRQRWTYLPVIMFSTLTARGAGATLDALTLGANDYVTKPSATRDREAALHAVRESLVPLIHLWGRRSRPDRTHGQALKAAPLPTRRPATIATTAGGAGAGVQPGGQIVDLTTSHAGRHNPSFRPVPQDKRPPLAVVIGISTGGPQALARVVPMLPQSLSVPILIVQHMPPVFTKLLADRLDASSVVPVHESEEGMALENGHVYVAAGGTHLKVAMQRGAVVLHHDDGPLENSCRPAVDVTLRSAAEAWGSRTLTVIMTGMGQDGLLGARALHAQGGTVLVQDEESSVVWGMPGAVAREGLADRTLPLDDIAAAIVGSTDRSTTMSRTGTR
jgi:two-component system chemotaxis response regulator CheB